MSPRDASVLSERIQGGAGRRSLPLPVKGAYALGELLPLRHAGLSYRVPGEMGAPLASAFERAFGMLARAHGRLDVKWPSRLLTPRWHAIFRRLAEHALARELVLSMPLEGGLPLYYFDIAAGFVGHQTDGGRPEVMRFCRGFSDDYDHALAKVVGECLERGTLLYYRLADLVRGSTRALRASGLPCVSPADLSVFLPWQIERRPECRFDDDSIFGWERMTSLTTGKEVLVPAQLVYWNYHPDARDDAEPFLRERNTHGAGAWYSLEGAILSGLLECIQRDGFFMHWLRAETPARIDPSGLTHARLVRLIDEAKSVGLAVQFFDITSELGIPTCLAALVREAGIPWISLGAACRLDGEVAMFDALLEAASVHHILATFEEPFRLAADHTPYTDTTFGTLKRLRFWANPEHKGHLEFFFRGGTKSVNDFGRGLALGAPAQSGAAKEDARRRLAFVVEALRRHGQDAYYFEAKHEALDELGFASVRVVAPGMLPMYCEDGNAPLGHPHVRGKMGSGRHGAWPPWPHPFP
jgi:thiazole/oxazole-forming peptide maturase SagD family component